MRVTRLLIPAALAAALLAPSGAGAGGFATVGVNPPPEGIEPGKAWQAELTILQHGRTPLEGVEPQVVVTRGSVQRTFPARPTGRPGVYRAEVVFPSPGSWRYVVHDGFAMTRHSFPPVRVGDNRAAPAANPAPPPANGGPDIALALALAAVAGLAGALGTAALQRRGPRAAPESG